MKKNPPGIKTKREAHESPALSHFPSSAAHSIYAHLYARPCTRPPLVLQLDGLATLVHNWALNMGKTRPCPVSLNWKMLADSSSI
jgi:hypothetical protein